MTFESVPPDEMGTHDHDDEFEDFFDELRTAFPARPVADEDEHVAGMIAAAHLQADKGNPVARPASNADAPAPQVSWLPKQRRNRMSDRNWSRRLALKVLAPVVVLFTMLGGVAWAGGLPQPLQKTASHVAGFAGLTVDDGTDAITDVETPDPAETDAPGATTFDQGGDSQDPTSTDNQDGNAQGEDNSGDTSTTDNQDGDSQGEDTSGDTSTTDNQDGNAQGEDNSGDTSSTDNQDGDSQGSTSGDGSSQDSSGDSSGSSDG